MVETSIATASLELPADERRALLEAGAGPPLPSAPASDALAAIRAGLRDDTLCLRSRGSDLRGAELVDRARRWATLLARRPAPRVALALDRSVEHLAVLLGAWWAGKCAVLLDPESPADRLGVMFAACGADTLVAGTRPSWLPATAVQLGPADADAASRSDEAAHPSAMAYVIYTSGSTGVPRGVEVSHAALASKLLSLRHASELGPGVRVLAHIAFSADASFMETLAPLAAGAEVYIATGTERRVPDGLLPLIRAYEPHLLFIAPTGARMLLDAGWAGSSSITLDIGGERFPVELARAFAGRVRRLVNGYGPTEASIKAAQYVIAASDLALADGASIPFGRPIHDVRLLVLRADGELAARGEVGELVVAGPHLADGYIGLEDATREKFPLLELEGERFRVYRTGDLARWTPALQLVFVGRDDDQVKLHGTRIELGEVVHAVTTPAEIRDAVCDVVDDTVAAFLLSDAPPDAVRRAAEAAAARLLPSLLRPTAYLVVDRWPLTPSGKVDRALLRARARQEARDGGVDRMLANLLGVDRVDPHATLDELGAHSLVRVALRAKLLAAGIDVPFADLYRARSVAEIVASLPARARAGAPPPARHREPQDGDRIDSGIAFELWVTRLNRPGSYGADAIWFTLDDAPGSAALRAAFERVCAAVPALRAWAEGVDKGLRWRIDRRQPPLTFLPPVDDGALDAALERTGHEQFGAGVESLGAPLFRAYVLESARRTGLLVVYHKLLLDKTSAERAVQSWVEALDGPIAARPWAMDTAIPGTPPTPGLVAMLEGGGRVEQLPLRTVRDLARAGLFPDFARAIGRVVRGLRAVGKFAPDMPKYEEERRAIPILERLSSVTRITEGPRKFMVVAPSREELRLDAREHAALRARCDRLRVSSHAVVLGAFAQALGSWLGEAPVFPAIIVDAYRPGQEDAIGMCSASVPTLVRPTARTVDAHVEAAAACLQVAIENRHVPGEAFNPHLEGPPPWSQFVFHGLTVREERRGPRGLRTRGALNGASVLPEVTYASDGELSVLFDAGRIDPAPVGEILRRTRRFIGEE